MFVGTIMGGNMEHFILYFLAGLLLLSVAVGIILHAFRHNQSPLASEKQEALWREIQQLTQQLQAYKTEKELLEKEKSQLKEDQANLLKACETQFENLANKIFNQQKEVNRTEINLLLGPLHEQLKEFALRQAQDKTNLANQIARVLEANGEIKNITDNFVRALQQKPQFRGEWGEETLRQLLNDMGLREGVQFFQQVVDENDKRPDFIVLLPNKQAVIIDAKTIWDKYFEYVKSTNEGHSHTLLKEHTADIKKTINNLATKKYRSGLKKFYNSINADMPEDPVSLVLMFVNPEAALTAALQADTSIVQEAREKNIALVSTATLISTLQIIQSLWLNYTVQQSNEEIKNLAEKVVADLGRFASQYIQLGKHLQNAQDAYDQSVSLVGESNKTGLLLSAQQLANLVPTSDLSKADKKVLHDTGFDGTQKKQHS